MSLPTNVHKPRRRRGIIALPLRFESAFLDADIPGGEAASHPLAFDESEQVSVDGLGLCRRHAVREAFVLDSLNVCFRRLLTLRIARSGRQWAMCGRLRVGKCFLHACRSGRGSHVFGLLARFT